MITATLDKKVIGRKLVCQQCGHEWHARIEGRDPIMCANHCKNGWYWNVSPDLIPANKPKHRKRR